MAVRCRIAGFGLRVAGAGFRAPQLGVQGLGRTVTGVGFTAPCPGGRLQGLDVQASGMNAAPRFQGDKGVGSRAPPDTSLVINSSIN